MTTNTWTPTATIPTSLKATAKTKMVAAGILTEPDTNILNEPDIAACSFVMQQDLSFWRNNSEDLKTDEIIALIRFFTLAEEVSPEWHGGDQSPVIHLNKLLKQQGHRLDKTLLKWIKERSNNPFLPNGPITF